MCLRSKTFYFLLLSFRISFIFSCRDISHARVIVEKDNGWVLYCHLQHHNDTIINAHAGRLLYKYIPLTLLQGFEKVTQGLRVRGSMETEHNCNILTSTLMAVSVVFFLFSWCSTGGPGVHSAGCWLSLLHLISNFSGPQTPSGFPELNNSSMPTRSPIRSLKSHV